MKPVVYGKNKQTAVAYGPNRYVRSGRNDDFPVSCEYGLWAWTRQIKYFIRFISGTRPNGEQKSQC